MTRYLIVLNGDLDRERAVKAIRSAPAGTRLELKGARRTLQQNDLMWALLTDVALQKEHAGKKFTPDQWKSLFLHACGREAQFVPALNGVDLIPWGQSSRDLSKEEMSGLIDFVLAWGAENGVTFHDPVPAAPDSKAAEYLAAG